MVSLGGPRRAEGTVVSTTVEGLHGDRVTAVSGAAKGAHHYMAHLKPT